MKVTLLGTGTSQGVPVIACECGVCRSDDPRDKRLRSSVMITKNSRNLVIDTGPDFRTQMLREKVMTLEAVIYTHEHKDHVAGMDDVRAFNFKEKKDMHLYGNEGVEEALKREFYYAFSEKKYPGVPEVVFHRIGNDPFKIADFHIIPIELLHYKMPVKGFRIDNFAYITDANHIAPEELAKLKGLEVLVINALRKEPHPSHFNVSEALEIVNTIRPKQVYFTHISHLLGKHDTVNKELPDGVQIGWDGLSFELPDSTN